MKATAAYPLMARLIERRPDGSALVEIPVIRVTEHLDLSRTAGGGKGSVAVTLDDLRQMEGNFRRWPKPVSVGFDGLDPGHERDRSGPSRAFVDALRIVGDALMATVDLSPSIASLFVDEKVYRASSMEAMKNPTVPTGSFEGWVLTGFILTNNPATDTTFRIAATGEITAEETGVHSGAIVAPSQAAKESNMDQEKSASTGAKEEKVMDLSAKLATQEQLVTSLRSQHEQMRSEAVTLEARLTESNKDLGSARVALAEANAKLSALQADLEYQKGQLQESENKRREAQVKLEAEQTRSLKDSVIALVHEAIDRGVSAALFEGVEADPVAWFRSRYTSIESLKQFLSALPTVDQSATTSGRPGAADAKADLSAETIEKFQRMGLDPKYAGVTDETQLRVLKDK